MRDDRKAVFAAIREALGAGRAAQLPGGRLAVPTVPTAARLSGADGVASFKRRLEAEHGDLSHVANWRELPVAVASRIKAAGLKGPLYISRDKTFESLDWSGIDLVFGPAPSRCQVSLTRGFAGMAETGSLVLVSGSERPTSQNFVPELHIVALEAAEIVPGFEDVWHRFRALAAGPGLPRALNFITGPSRSGDIEQTLYFGAHGPLMVHAVLVGDPGQDR